MIGGYRQFTNSVRNVLPKLATIIGTAVENGVGQPKASNEKDCSIMIINCRRAMFQEYQAASLID